MELRGITVCGLGKLGSPLAAAFAASKVPVLGLDVDLEKIACINDWRPPVDEPQLAEYLELSTVRTNLRATISPGYATRFSDACLFVTPTPSLPDGGFDHAHLLGALTSVARAARQQGRRNYAFIVCSTVMPGFMDSQAAPLLRSVLEDLRFMLVYKPEFIALGTVIENLHRPDVLLIGADSEEAGEYAERLYRRMVFDNPPVPAQQMTLIEAELAKIALNCAVTMKISFANQIGILARRLGADPVRVLSAVGADSRIGPGALRAGLPFGGPCFPRDNLMFRRVASLVGEHAPLAEATDLINKLLFRRILDELLQHQGDVGILGTAYKPNTAITDESPGMWWRWALIQHGRCVKTHDPRALHSHSLEEVAACPIVVVACAWPEYRSLSIPKTTFLFDPMRAIGEIRGNA
jgi:UDPglucose 6-dehydrogenase